jgi:hypothetical protein
MGHLGTVIAYRHYSHTLIHFVMYTFISFPTFVFKT